MDEERPWFSVDFVYWCAVLHFNAHFMRSEGGVIFHPPFFCYFLDHPNFVILIHSPLPDEDASAL